MKILLATAPVLGASGGEIAIWLAGILFGLTLFTVSFLMWLRRHQARQTGRSNVPTATESRPPRSLECPNCQRVFPIGTRYCPHDAEPLAPHHDPFHEAHAHALLGDDKICPTCAARYDLAASYCGRDGTTLVSVN